MRTGCSEEYANFGGKSQKKQKVQMMIFIILKLCVLCILQIFTTYNQQMHNIQGAQLKSGLSTKSRIFHVRCYL
jgi:hypothetical protein